nr:reverse transcriptase domain-containing protein [Tanacetum cinerariifolium]
MIKEHDQQAKMKATPRKLAYADLTKKLRPGHWPKDFLIDYLLNPPTHPIPIEKLALPIKVRRLPPTHLRRSRRLEDQSTNKEKARRERRAKLPWNIRVHKGNKDPEDHLGIFLAAAEQEEWPMPTWCKMLRQTLRGTGVPPVLHILAFKHGRNHPELAKKLNDKIPKMVDEMFERVRAFIRGEVVVESAKMVCPSQRYKGYVRLLWSRGLERARNKEGPREARRNMGKEIESEGSLLTAKVCQKSYMNTASETSMSTSIKTPKVHGSDDRFFERNISPPRVIDLRVTMRREGRSKTVLMDFPIIKFCSPYNIIIGSTRMRSLGAVCSTIHSMIKFPTNQGVVTMETSREALRECKHLERVKGSLKEVQWRQHEEQMSRIKEQVIIRSKSNSRRGRSLGLMSLEKTQSKEDIEEVFTISHECPDQYVTMGATLKTNCKQLLADVLRENMEVFAWNESESTAVLRFVMEYQLKMYPLAELVVHKRRPMAPKGRLSL